MRANDPRYHPSQKLKTTAFALCPACRRSVPIDRLGVDVDGLPVMQHHIHGQRYCIGSGRSVVSVSKKLARG